MRHTVIRGDARRIPLADRSVQCVVTSPPYYGLRDYGTAGQIGLERTVSEYVASMVAVFEEVRRVLRDDGVAWLNVGDSFFGGGYSNHTINGDDWKSRMNGDKRKSRQQDLKRDNPSFKPKDLIGVPWMLAFALRDAGWYLRSEVIWFKTNPMPESVRDRPTKAHEQVFLLTKSDSYFYDQDAIREPIAKSTKERDKYSRIVQSGNKSHVPNSTDHSGLHAPYAVSHDHETPSNPLGRNCRSVWDIPLRPFKGSHFATMVPDLARRCILAGTSAIGCCPKCGAPFERVVEKERRQSANVIGDRGGNGRNGTVPFQEVVTIKGETIRPTCPKGCPGGEPVPCTVFDPFGGANTTGTVAAQLGRSSIVTELNPEYAAMGRVRVMEEIERLNRPHKVGTKVARRQKQQVEQIDAVKPLPGQMSLFG